MIWTGHVARTGEISAYKVLVGKPEGIRQLGRRRHRWEDDIRLDLTDIGWKVVDWMHLALDRGRSGLL
jgi:hypothetical protein